MKLFIIRFGIFCILLLIGLSLFSTFLKTGQKNYDSTGCYKLKLMLDEKSLDPEIIVFGSSVAEGSIIPKVLSEKTGKTSFNAALSGRRIIDWNSVAFSFLDYTKNNKIIILDIFPNAFNETNQLYFPHEFYPYLQNKFVKRALSPISETYNKMTSLPFYYLTQLNTTIILNSIVGFRDLLFNFNSKIPDGYMGYNSITSTYEKSNLSNLIKPEISDRSIELYEDIFSAAAEKNIRVVLVGTPIFIEGRRFYQNIDSIYNWGKRWDSIYTNVDFVNFLNDKAIILNKNYFSNNTHLNDSGAMELSKKLGIVLTQTREE